MTSRWHIVVVLLHAGLVLLPSVSVAQTERHHVPPNDSAIHSTSSSLVDEEGRQLLDEPGGSSVDPDALFDYLDGLPSTPKTNITNIHGDPATSWIAAHQAVRNLIEHRQNSGDSATRFSLRSRAASSFNANDQQGYKSGEYLGSPYAVYNRLRASSQLFDLGVVIQKRAWESEFADQFNGFVSLKNPLEVFGAFQVRRAIAGDYSLSFGDGLLFGGGATVSKSSDAVSGVEQRGFGFKGTLGNAPSSSYRGGAIELGLGPVNVTAFGSSRFVDANVQGDTIRTLYSTPYHRTPAELALKNIEGMHMSGIRVGATNGDTSSLNLSLGVTAMSFYYDAPYAGTPGAPFFGTTMRAGSIDALAIGGHASLSGELAESVDARAAQSAWIVTCLAEPFPSVGLSALYRHVPNGFVSPFGQISGEAVSSLGNANGIYLGVTVVPFEGVLRVNAYADFENTLLPSTTVFDKQTHDYLAAAHLTAILNRLDLDMIVRSTTRQGIVTIAGGLRPEYATVAREKSTIRIEAHYHLTDVLSLRSRAELVIAPLPSESVEHGFLLLQELRATGLPNRTSVQFDVCRFQTDSFNSALYLYQGIVPGSGAVSLLDSKGWHFGIRTTTRVFSELAVSLAATGSI